MKSNKEVLKEMKKLDWNYFRDNYENLILIYSTSLVFLGEYLQEQIINFLLENGSDINFKDKYIKGETVLHVATKKSNEEMVKKLLEKGADPNIKNDEGITSLHYAIFYKNENNVKLLLEKGADPNIKEKYGHTALDLNSVKGCENEEIEKLLLEKRAYKHYK